MTREIDRRLVTLGLAASTGLGSGSPSRAAAPVADEMTLGSPRAKITVVEYASVACPVCGRWYKEVFPAFKAKYIDRGKAHFVFREMLVGDEGEVAIAAAGFLLARCVARANYFEVVDAIFASQPKLFETPKAVMLAIAQRQGLTEARFNACVEDQTALQALSARVDANANRDDVRATPTFVINGKSMTPGFHTLSELDAAIGEAR